MSDEGMRIEVARVGPLTAQAGALEITRAMLAQMQANAADAPLPVTLDFNLESVIGYATDFQLSADGDVLTCRLSLSPSASFVVDAARRGATLYSIGLVRTPRLR